MTFTAEDQEWFTSSIELIVGQIVKSEVGAVEQKLSERIDQVEHKFSERMVLFEHKLSDHIEQVEQKLSERIDQVDVKVERVETALLTEFHKWASPTASRINSHTSLLRTLDMAHELPAERVTKLEKPQSN